MENSDAQEFAFAWTNAHENAANKQPLTEKQISYAFDMLLEYPIHVVTSAIKRHSKSEIFAPTIAHIHVIIKNLIPQRPSPDEAWALAPKDHAGVENTVVVTLEIWRAWGKVEEDWQVDKIGARKSFLAIYQRLCDQAVEMQLPIEWHVYEGNESNSRKAQIIKQAIDDGKLNPKNYAEKLRILAPSDFASFGLMLEHKKKQKGLSEIAKREISKMQEILKQWEEREIEEKKERKQAKIKFAQVEGAVKKSKKPMPKPNLHITMPEDEEREFIRACIEQSNSRPTFKFGA